MKILLVGHDASLTGAPKFLLRFGQWLKKRKDSELHVILDRGGPLLPEYRELGPLSIWSLEEPLPVWYRLKRFLCRKLNLQFQGKNNTNLIKALNRREFDLVFCNTSVNGHILERIGSLNCPMLVRVAELESALYVCNADGRVAKTFECADRIIAVSDSVSRYIVNQFKYPETHIDLRYGSVPAIDVASVRKESDAIRNELGIPVESIVVGGVGTLDWRKGFDQFLHVAKTVRDQSGDKCFFLWIGADPDSDDYHRWHIDVCKMGLENSVHFEPRKHVPYPYFALFDIFLMSSREDPFPLVNLEVAQFGVPIVGFGSTGGTPELLESVGLLCPGYGDFAHAAAIIGKYVEDADFRHRDGELLKTYVLENHITEANLPLIYDDVQRCIDEFSKRSID